MKISRETKTPMILGLVAGGLFAVRCAGQGGSSTLSDMDAGNETDPFDSNSALDTSTELSDEPIGYFIAVHNEPAHQPSGETFIAEEFEILRGIVEEADGYGIKLTLMLPPQWADHISIDAVRLAQVKAWQESGHELAVHHHSIFHGKWDGYTSYTEAEAYGVRRAKGIDPPEIYLGNLDDYSAKIGQLGLGIKSGCANDEHDKNALPDTVLYDTCSGFANHGALGMRQGDAESADKGINEYVLVGTWNGIPRRWLAHYQITRPERVEAAKEVFDGMAGGVFGGVVHSKASQAEHLSSFMEFLHERDAEANRSYTISEIIKSGLLPEETLTQTLLEERWDTGPCGDGECSPFENDNPDICPIDCF